MKRPANFSSLKEALTDWVYADVATYYLACCLGLMPEEDGTLDGFRDAKHVFWGSSDVGTALWKLMNRLEVLGVLEFDPMHTMWRWNPSFRGDWKSSKKEPKTLQ